MKIPFTDIQLGFNNIISCKGFEESTSVGLTFGPCAYAKLGLVLLFFISAFVRKWIGEEAGFEYSFLWANIGGLFSYFITISIIGNFKISFIVGLVAMAIFGFGGGAIFGDGDEE